MPKTTTTVDLSAEEVNRILCDYALENCDLPSHGKPIIVFEGSTMVDGVTKNGRIYEDVQAKIILEDGV